MPEMNNESLSGTITLSLAGWVCNAQMVAAQASAFGDAPKQLGSVSDGRMSFYLGHICKRASRTFHGRELCVVDRT